MSKVPTDKQHPTADLATRWFKSELSLIQTDPEAALAAIDELERKAQFARTVLAEANGEAAANGAAKGYDQVFSASPGTSKERTPPAHGLTRNQIAKVRGVYILEVLARTGGPHTLAVIHADMLAHNFRDENGVLVTEAAIRSHLYRLKLAKVVEIVSNGLYDFADGGFAHLQRERIVQAPLIEKFRAAQG